MSSVQPAKLDGRHFKRSDVFHHGENTNPKVLPPDPLALSASPRRLIDSAAQLEQFTTSSAAQRFPQQSSSKMHGRRSRHIFNHNASPRDPDEDISEDARRTEDVASDCPSSRRSSGQWGVRQPAFGRPSRPADSMTAASTPANSDMPPEDLQAPLPSPQSPQAIVAGGGWPNLPKRPLPSLNPSVDAFSAAISQMYSGRSANPLLPSHGLSGPISAEQLRSRASSTSSQATRRGPLRADHTLHTPRSANDREIEEINRRAVQAAQRTRPARRSHEPQRPLSAQLHPTYYTDLADDTVPGQEPTSGRSDTSPRSDVPRPSSARRRVYLIKRPQSAPVYGRITPVSNRSDDGETLSGRSSVQREDTPVAFPGANSQEESLPPKRKDNQNYSVEDREVSASQQTTSKREFVEDTGDRISDTVQGSVPQSAPFSDRHVSPLRFAGNDSETTQHREQSVHVPPVYHEAVSNTSDPERESSNEKEPTSCHSDSNSVDTVTNHNSVQTLTTKHSGHNHSDFTQPSTANEERCHEAKDRYVTVSLCESAEVPSETEQGEVKTVFSEKTSPKQDRKSLTSVVDNTTSAVAACLEHVTCDSSLPLETDSETQSARHSDHQTPVLGEEKPKNHKDDNEQKSQRRLESDPTPKKSASKAVPKSTVPESPSHAISASTGSHPSPTKTSSKPEHSTGSSIAKSSPRFRKKVSSPPVSRPETTTSSALSATLPRERLQTLSNLQSSRLTYGSVDSLLVGVDAETNPSPKKTKNKKSRFKSWFTSKKGKYNPGDEAIPVIENPLEFARRYNSSLDLPRSHPVTPSHTDGVKSALHKHTGSHPSLNTNSHSTSAHTSPHLADTMESSPATSARNSKASQEPQHDNVQTKKNLSSLKTDGGAAISTSTESPTRSQQLLSPKNSVERSDTQSTTSEDVKKGSKTFSLLSSEVLKGSSSGCYENTNVTFNTNVTRHEMITIKGSSLTSYDKSVVLNDSGFPDDLSSTFRAKPVMVRERQISSSSSQDQQSLASFTGRGPDSPSSLSVVEMNFDGTMKLSNSHGSTEDLELLSKASRIVQAQKSDGLLNDGDDDEHELVVIREYVFAAKKISTDGGSARSDISTYSRSVSSSTVQASASNDDGNRELSNATSVLKEEDSGLDSPPSFKDSLPALAKPKDDGPDSRDFRPDEIHTEKIEPAQAIPVKFDSSDKRAETSRPEAFLNTLFAIENRDDLDKASPMTSDIPGSGGGGSSTVDIGASVPSRQIRATPSKKPGGLSQPHDTASLSADDVGAASSASPDTAMMEMVSQKLMNKMGDSDASAVKPSDAFDKVQTKAANDDKENEISSALSTPMKATHDKQDGSSLDVSTDFETSGPVYAVPDKKRKILSNQNSTDSSKMDGDKAQVKPVSTMERVRAGHRESPELGPRPLDDAANNDRMEVSSVSSLQSTPSLGKSDDGREAKSAANKQGENIKLPERCSRYRDSLTEEEYHKPWESDFSSIEDSIRSRMTSAFPPALEEEECEEETPSSESSLSETAIKAASSPLYATANPSKGTHEDIPKASTEKTSSDTETSLSQDSVEKDTDSNSLSELKTAADTEYADVQYGADIAKTAEDTTIPVSAVPKLSTTASPRKISDKSDRPSLPLPPSPPVAKPLKEEDKPAEKVNKSGAAVPPSPAHHNKLKDKFKKVFSHSSDDKKAAKAEHKKVTPKTQKKASIPHAENEIKGPNIEQKTTTKAESTSGKKDVITASKDEVLTRSVADTTETLYMSPDLPNEEKKTTHPSTEKDQKEHKPEQRDETPEKLYVEEVKLPFSPKEAKKIIKAEKKNAAKLQQEESKDASSTDESKVSSPRAPNKALKWIKKKLATKGKKTPRTKKYDINATEQEGEHETAADSETSSVKVSDMNSASEDSHSSSNSSSDSDEEEEKKKTKKKMPFFGGKKGKKKKTEQESDSDTSGEESKSKLFSWSLGRKKAADSSDHEDNLPASYKKSSDWTPSEDTVGVSGTFRKISDTVPKGGVQSAVDSKQTATTQQCPEDNKQTTEEMVSTAQAQNMTKRDPVSDSNPDVGSKDDEAKSIPGPEGDVSSEKVEARKEPGKDHQGLNVTATAPKLFSFEDSEEQDMKEQDIGEYAELRKDAVIERRTTNCPKLPRNSGYELAKPLFLEDDSAVTSNEPSGIGKDGPKTSQDTPDMSKNLESTGTTISQTEQSDAKLKDNRAENPERSVAEDTIVPVKAAQPVHQAFNSLRKIAREGSPDHKHTENSSKPNTPKSQQMMQYSPLPEKKNISSGVAKTKQKPKETEDAIAALEDEIIPCKAEDAVRGHSLQRKSPTKTVPAVKPTDDKTTAANSVADPNLESDRNVADTATESLPTETSQNNLDITAQVKAVTEESPRSSDESPGRTYLDGPGFLDAAKASWSLQNNQVIENVKPDPNKPDEQGNHTDTKNKDVLGQSALNANLQTLKQSDGDAQSKGTVTDSQCVELRKSPDTNMSDPPTDNVHVTLDPVLKTANTQQSEKVVNEDSLNSSTEQISSENAASTVFSAPPVPDSKPPESNRRTTRAVTPADLPGAGKPKDGVQEDKETDKAESQTDTSKESSIDWLDSDSKSSESVNKLPVPKKPTTPKPKVQPKLFSKPSGDKPSPENDSNTLKPKPNVLPRKPSAKEETIAAFVASNLKADSKTDRKALIKADAQGKPTPPEKPKKPVKTDTTSEDTEVQLRSPAVKSPEPKPRTSLIAVKDVTKITPDAIKETVSSLETPTPHDVRSLQAGDSEKAKSVLSSTLSEDSQTDLDPSTSTWGEEDSRLSLGPNVGDFTLSLDPHTERSEKVFAAYAATTFTRPRTDSKENQPDLNTQNQVPTSETQNESDLTNVTLISQISDSSTPLEKTVPVSQSTPLSSDLTSMSLSSEVTMTSISTIHDSANTSKNDTTSTGKTSHQEEEIYEPIFFDDIKNPKSKKKPTEAPPIRPEKVKKRNAEPPKTVHPDFDDDADNMYDVPPSRRKFEFPKESSFPVMSFVDKRSSKALSKGTTSFDPEDTITPYATCHRTSQFLKQDSDYDDDENPYMNNDDNLQALSTKQTLSVNDDADEQVHASLSELFPKARKDKAAEEDAPAKEESDLKDPENPQTAEPTEQRAPEPEQHGDRQSKVESSHSDSSSSSSSSDSDSGSETAASPGRKDENSKDKPEKDDTTTKSADGEQKGNEVAKETEEEDQYLKSPEYKTSVDEIDKLYAALEKEEEEMEKHSSSKAKSTPEPLARLLSFEEQRAELKPLKSKPKEESPPATEQNPKAPPKPKTAMNTKKQDDVKEIQSFTSTETRTVSAEPTITPEQSTKVESSVTLRKHSVEPSIKEPEEEKTELMAHQLTESRTDNKKEEPSVQTSVLPPVVGYSKLVEKVVHIGDEQQVKVTADIFETSPGKEGTEPETGTSPKTCEDFSSFKLDLPETSLEAEVMRHTMYAQVTKAPSTSSAPTKQEQTSPDPDPEQDASPPELPGSPPPEPTDPPPTEVKASTLSSFIVSKGRGSPSPKQAKRQAPSPATSRSPKITTKAKSSPKFTKSPRVPPPKPPQREFSQDTEKPDDTKKVENTESPKTGDTQAAESNSPTVLEKISTTMSSAASDLKESELPEEPKETSKPPEQTAPKPRPQPRPRDSLSASPSIEVKVPQAPEEPATEPSTGEDQASFKDSERTELQQTPEVPARVSPLHSRTASHTMETGEVLVHVKKRRRSSAPGATAAIKSDEGGSDDDSTEDDEGEEDEEDGQDGCESPPLPERKYKKKKGKGKYNEYSNVIRVDSQKLKDARIKSLSRSTLMDDASEKKDKDRLRNAVSMEGGLDKKTKKIKKTKSPRDGAGGDGGEEEKKHKKPLFKSIKDLFGTKKKKVKEGKGEDGDEENVYEVVDEAPGSSKPKKEAAAKKNTWPKQQKRKKSDQSAHPPTTPHLIAVDSSHESKDIRPIGRLLQLNPDGTQLLELIRPPSGNLGVQLTQGNEETLHGKFVSGFVDKSTEKLLSGILSIGDQVLKINDRPVDTCPLIEVHDIIDTQQRLKFLVYPADHN